mmetsp:Transcript_10430/g.25566  ORF Transcript_10430/g.25566 Transcript_10430/m.25566 type:complete len:216 (-) Transcript_10430:331-978(-)|eukprot:CAMPEP_0179000120 /NCGR_PEP_ID=MMETSP0795-20121207/10478_1 /TAXON_ID=88552 /ORGANISM="Amoebophrya sp., Strain Ameob2" /LENGTH=215 /DNA_ID=CAMNT_0020693047 /DNA_START=392 /DNA_END=1039 /DNA_ORIENTATION=-
MVFLSVLNLFADSSGSGQQPFCVLPFAPILGFFLLTVLPVCAIVNVLFQTRLPTFFVKDASKDVGVACWLAYFVLYILLKPLLMDSLALFVPLVYELSLLFFLWLYHPETRGALLLVDLFFGSAKGGFGFGAKIADSFDLVLAFAKKWGIQAGKKSTEARFYQSCADEIDVVGGTSAAGESVGPGGGAGAPAAAGDPAPPATEVAEPVEVTQGSE